MASTPPAKLVFALVRPYRKWLFVVFAAMMVETAMSLASPWPLKVVIDNVVGHHRLPEALEWLRDLPLGESGMALARQLAMTTYRSEVDFDLRFAGGVEPDGSASIVSYLEYQGRKLV